MLRRSILRLQCPRQPWADSLAYSSAFVACGDRPVDDYHRATALYSTAASQLPRRRGHPQRQKAYTQKVRCIAWMARDKVGMPEQR